MSPKSIEIVPRLLDVGDHFARVAGCARRAEAVAAPHPLRDARSLLFPERQHRKCAKICGDTSGNYHPHGEAVIYPTLVHMAQPWAMRETPRRRPGQLRFGRRRSAGGHALHRGAHDPSRRRAHDRHGEGHGRFRPELRRDANRADGFPGRLSESARQRRHRHRRRHGDQHSAAQSRSKSSTASARRSTIRTSRSTIDEVREGAGFPDRLRHLRHGGRSANISRPAAAA